MYQGPHKNAIGDGLMSKQDICGIPTACRFENLCSNDKHRIHNESVNWLIERKDKLPLWSRLRETNCVGETRKMLFFKNKDYEIEIPGRLLSIFGSMDQQTRLLGKMKGMANGHLVGCILALCAALKYSFREWSINLLDSITAKATQIYPNLLKKLNITDKEFGLSNLTELSQLDDGDYQVQVQQVASGYLYIRYGVNEFNLARALTWFFQRYQFGLVQCGDRLLAIGFTLDTDYGFFMYDCQSRDLPLMDDSQANSYILRTNHLQILLYCLIISLNISKDMFKFALHSVDIRPVNPLELRILKKEIYVPTIVGSMKKEVEKKVNCGAVKKKINNNLSVNTTVKYSKNNTTTNAVTKQSLKSCTSLTPKSLYKSNSRSKAKTSKSENLKPQVSHKNISLDPNKEYYIIAVPKPSNAASTKFLSKYRSQFKEEKQDKLEKLNEETSKGIKVNIHRISNPNSKAFGNQIDSNFTEEGESETIYLNKSASTATLTPESVNDKTSNFVNPLGLKVYLVNNSCNLNTDLDLH